MQTTKEEEANIDDLNMVSNEPDYLMDIIVIPYLKRSIWSSEEKAIAKKVAKDSQFIKVLHIEFIFRNRPLTLEDYSQYLKHLMIKLHIQAKSQH